MRQACEDNNMSMAELAFGYARDMDEIDSLVVGADESAHIEQNIKLLNGPSLELKQQNY